MCMYIFTIFVTVYRDIVEYLMSSGATLMVHDLQTKRTPLHAAAYNGHVETMRVLLRSLTNTTHVDCVDVYGR